MAELELALIYSSWRPTDQFLEQHVSDLVTHNHTLAYLVEQRLVQYEMKRKESWICIY